MANCAGCKNPGCYTGDGSQYASLDGSSVLRTANLLVSRPVIGLRTITYFSQNNIFYTYFLKEILHFHGRTAPETGFITGYGAVIQYYRLEVPVPDTLALIIKKNKNCNEPGWIVFGPKYKPSDTLTGH